MSICKHCGKEIADGSKFCQFCGKPQEETQPVSTPEIKEEANETAVSTKEERETESANDTSIAQTSDTQKIADAAQNMTSAFANAAKAVAAAAPVLGTAAMGKAKEKMSNAVNTVSEGVSSASKRPNFKKYLIFGVAALALITVVVVVLSSIGKTVDLGKYIYVTFDGYDEYGTAQVSFDWEAVMKKYGDDISYTRKAKGMAQKTSAFEYLMSSVTYKVDKTTDLKNGDEIHITINVPSNIEDILNCKIKYDDITIPVKGLEALTEVDPFADLTVTFSGVNGEGQADYSYNGFGLSYYDFNIDRSYGLSEGDTVKITVDEYSVESLAEDYGMKPTATEKEYTVEGLGHYLTSASELSDDDRQTIEENARVKVNDYVKSRWDLDKVTLISCTPVGNYVQTSKSSDYTQSQFAVVFKVISQIHEENNTTQDVTEYISVTYFDIVINADGTATFSADYTSLSDNYFTVEVQYGESVWDCGYYDYRGFTNTNDMKDYELINETDSFNYEWNVDEAA